MDKRHVKVQFHLPQDTWLKFKNLRMDLGYRTYQEYIEKELLEKNNK